MIVLVRQWVKEECPRFKNRLPFAVRSSRAVLHVNLSGALRRSVVLLRAVQTKPLNW